VGVYDVEKALPFLDSPFARAQAALNGKENAKTKWRDCAADPAFDSSAAAWGTTLYYRPPRFGPLRDKGTRSAWQCLF